MCSRTTLHSSKNQNVPSIPLFFVRYSILSDHLHASVTNNSCTICRYSPGMTICLRHRMCLFSQTGTGIQVSLCVWDRNARTAGLVSSSHSSSTVPDGQTLPSSSQIPDKTPQGKDAAKMKRKLITHYIHIVVHVFNFYKHSLNIVKLSHTQSYV